MHFHMVLAHPEFLSFSNHLVNVSKSELEQSG